MIVLLVALVGAVLSRWHGGGILPYKVPKAIKSLVFAAPFCLLADSWWMGLVVLGLCALGKSTGQGGWFDLGTWVKPRDDERLEFLIKWLHGRLPEYWYDALGMSLKGLAEVSGAVIVSPWMAVAGLLKGPSYMLGRVVSAKYPTEMGEYISGAVLYAGLALLI